jgi:hypothetical protein
MAQAPMSHPAKPTLLNKNATLLREVPRNNRLGASAHVLYDIASHACKRQQLWHFELHQGADDIVHIAARAKVTTRPVDHDRMNVCCPLQAGKQVSKFRIALKRDGVFALWAVERDGGDTIRDRP